MRSVASVRVAQGHPGHIAQCASMVADLTVSASGERVSPGFSFFFTPMIGDPSQADRRFASGEVGDCTGG
jgi:hypothetical protein